MTNLTVKVMPHDLKRFAVFVKIDDRNIICEILDTYKKADQRIPALKAMAMAQYNLALELERKHQ